MCYKCLYSAGTMKTFNMKKQPLVKLGSWNEVWTLLTDMPYIQINAPQLMPFILCYPIHT